MPDNKIPDNSTQAWICSICAGVSVGLSVSHPSGWSWGCSVFLVLVALRHVVAIGVLLASMQMKMYELKLEMLDQEADKESTNA